MSSPNQVRLVGRISRIGPLKYSPSGIPVREATVAVSQTIFGKESVGYHDLLFYGDIAETGTTSLRVGSVLKVAGVLWNRNYRNRKGQKVTETKIVVETSEPATIAARPRPEVRHEPTQ